MSDARDIQHGVNQRSRRRRRREAQVPGQQDAVRTRAKSCRRPRRRFTRAGRRILARKAPTAAHRTAQQADRAKPDGMRRRAVPCAGASSSRRAQFAFWNRTGSCRGPRTVPCDQVMVPAGSSEKSGIRFNHSSSATVISMWAKLELDAAVDAEAEAGMAVFLAVEQACSIRFNRSAGETFRGGCPVQTRAWVASASR